MPVFIVTLETADGFIRVPRTTFPDDTAAHAFGWEFAADYGIPAIATTVFPRPIRLTGTNLRRSRGRLGAAIATAAAMTVIAAVTLYGPSPAPCEVVAIDSRGNEFIAGSGDDSAAAWRNAIFPDNWREITTRNCR